MPTQFVVALLNHTQSVSASPKALASSGPGLTGVVPEYAKTSQGRTFDNFNLIRFPQGSKVSCHSRRRNAQNSSDFAFSDCFHAKQYVVTSNTTNTSPSTGAATAKAALGAPSLLHQPLRSQSQIAREIPIRTAGSHGPMSRWFIQLQ